MGTKDERMNAKTKFMKFYDKLPEQAKRDLVWKPYDQNPMSIGIMYFEIKHGKHSKELLEEMGFKDDKKEETK